MWSWSEHQAERATAASFTGWRTREPEPTVTDPEFSETEDATETPGGRHNSGTGAGHTPRDDDYRPEDDDAMIEASTLAYLPMAEMALAGV